MGRELGRAGHVLLFGQTALPRQHLHEADQDLAEYALQVDGSRCVLQSRRRPIPAGVPGTFSMTGPKKGAAASAQLACNQGCEEQATGAMDSSRKAKRSARKVSVARFAAATPASGLALLAASE